MIFSKNLYKFSNIIVRFDSAAANSEDDLDPLGEAPFEKFDTTFANVEPIDFLFSDGREELDLFDVFSSAQVSF